MNQYHAIVETGVGTLAKIMYSCDVDAAIFPTKFHAVPAVGDLLSGRAGHPDKQVVAVKHCQDDTGGYIELELDSVEKKDLPCVEFDVAYCTYSIPMKDEMRCDVGLYRNGWLIRTFDCPEQEFKLAVEDLEEFINKIAAHDFEPAINIEEYYHPDFNEMLDSVWPDCLDDVNIEVRLESIGRAEDELNKAVDEHLKREDGTDRYLIIPVNPLGDSPLSGTVYAIYMNGKLYDVLTVPSPLNIGYLNWLTGSMSSYGEVKSDERFRNVVRFSMDSVIDDIFPADLSEFFDKYLSKLTQND